MLKYVDAKVVFQEVPDEITLAINISNCPCHCKGCHSSYLAEDIGTPLDEDSLVELLLNNKGITCICFMGNAENIPMLWSYIKMSKSNLKTAMYVGTDIINIIKDYGYFLNFLDYLKVGSYISNLGGLDSKTTNQRLYSLKEVRTEGKFTDYETVFTDITYKLQK